MAQYTAAAKTSTLDSTARALSSLAEILRKDRKLPAILNAPRLTVSDKNQIVNELVKQTAGTDKGETVKNFLKTLAENNRLGLLEEVCEKFESLVSVHRGEVELLVTSAAVCSILSYPIPSHLILFSPCILLVLVVNLPGIGSLNYWYIFRECYIVIH